MANLNKVYLIGNLTRDPEVRHTPKGTAVAEIGLAINRVWSNEQGQKQEETTFVDVTLWGRTAELAQQYLTKGRPVYIEGRLTLETWADKQSGQKRSKLKVVGEALQFLGGGQAQQHAQRPENDSRGATRRTAPRNMDIPSNRADENDFEDIPF